MCKLSNVHAAFQLLRHKCDWSSQYNACKLKGLTMTERDITLKNFNSCDELLKVLFRTLE